MRFDEKAYEKLFPREPEPIRTQSAVDTFKPTEKIMNETREEADAPEVEQFGEEVNNGNGTDSEFSDE